MGVDGLTAYVRKYFNDIAHSLQLQRGDRLIIDGSSLLYHLLSRCSRRESDELNFDGLQFANVVMQFLWPFRCCGVKLTVVMDGMLEVEKKLATRVARRNNAWQVAKGLLERGRAKARRSQHNGGENADEPWVNLEGRDGGNQIKPQRASEVMIIMLRLLDNVTLLFAPYEADPYIAHLIKESFGERDSQDTFRGVLTNDSDFLIYGCDLDVDEVSRRKYVGYIPYGQLRMNNDRNDQFDIYVKGTTPHALAQMLKLRHVMLLPFLSVACGNDYIPAGWLFHERSFGVTSKSKLYYVAAAGRFIAERYGRAGRPEKFDRSSMETILMAMGENEPHLSVKLDAVMDAYDQYLAIPDSKYAVPSNVLLPKLIPPKICQFMRSEDDDGDDRKIQLYHDGYISPALLQIRTGTYFCRTPLEPEHELGFSQIQWAPFRHKIYGLLSPVNHIVREYGVKSAKSNAIETTKVEFDPKNEDLRDLLREDMDRSRALDCYVHLSHGNSDQFVDGSGIRLRYKVSDVIVSLIDSILDHHDSEDEDDRESLLRILSDAFLNVILVCTVMCHRIGFNVEDVRHLVASCLYCVLWRAPKMQLGEIGCLAHVLKRSAPSTNTLLSLFHGLITGRSSTFSNGGEAHDDCHRLPFGRSLSIGSADNMVRFYGQGKSYTISASFFTGLHHLDLLNQVLCFPADKDSFAPILTMFSVMSLAEMVEGITGIDDIPHLKNATNSLMNLITLH